MVAILTTDEPGNYCAVQYARTTNPIHRLTGNKIRFLNAVNRVRRVGGKSFDTNIAAALGYTGFQLLARGEDANKIIILGDGLENVGFPPKRIARILLKRKVGICAVAVGGFSTAAIRGIVGGDNNRNFHG